MLRALIKKQTLEMLSFLFKSGKAAKCAPRAVSHCIRCL